MLDTLIAFVSVVLTVSIVVTAGLEVFQRLDGGVLEAARALRARLFRMPADVPEAPSARLSIRAGILRTSLMRLHEHLHPGSKEAAVRVDAFLGGPLANPTGRRGVDDVSKEVVEAWVDHHLPASAPGRRDELDAWWATFEAESTRALKLRLQSVGILIGLIVCVALGLDAWTLTRDWREAPWEASVLAWQAGWPSAEVKVVGQLEDRLAAGLCPAGSADCDAARSFAGLARAAPRSTGPRAWLDAVEVAFRKVEPPGRKEDALAVLAGFRSQADQALLQPGGGSGGDWGGREWAGALVLALLASLGAPFWFDLLRRLRNFASPPAGVASSKGNSKKEGAPEAAESRPQRERPGTDRDPPEEKTEPPGAGEAAGES